jgi:hypothetical protein
MCFILPIYHSPFLTFGFHLYTFGSRILHKKVDYYMWQEQEHMTLLTEEDTYGTTTTSTHAPLSSSPNSSSDNNDEKDNSHEGGGGGGGNGERHIQEEKEQGKAGGQGGSSGLANTAEWPGVGAQEFGPLRQMCNREVILKQLETLLLRLSLSSRYTFLSDLAPPLSPSKS